MQQSNRYFLQGAMFLVLAQIMVGINIVCSKYILTSIPLLFLLTARFTLASVILLPLHWFTKDRKKSLRYHFTHVSKKDWIYLLTQALCAGIFFNALMLLGLHYTDANVAGIITSALPAIIALMSWLVLREKMSAKKGLCLLFATLGLVIIAYDKFKIGADHAMIGDIIILLSLIPEATYYVLSKRHPSRLPIFLAPSLFNGINALILVFILLFTHPVIPSIDTTGWLILILLGLTSGLFYVFWFLGSQRVDGLMASLSTAVMPVSTVILARMILGEQLSIQQAMGMGFVILSIVIYAKR